MNIEERMRELIVMKNLRPKELEALTGIDRDRWSNLRKSVPTAKIRTEELDVLVKNFPEYAYWLVTGLEIPEHGQISPMTEQAREKLNLKVG